MVSPPNKRVASSSPLRGMTKKSPSTYRPVLTTDEHRGETNEQQHVQHATEDGDDGDGDEQAMATAAYNLEEDELHVEFLRGGGGNGAEDDAYNRLRVSVDSGDDDGVDLEMYKMRGDGDGGNDNKDEKAPPPPPPPPQDTMAMRSSPPSSSDESHGPSTATPKPARPLERTAPANPFELLPANSSSAEEGSSSNFDIVEQDDLDTDDELESGMFRYSTAHRSPNRLGPSSSGSNHAHDAGSDPALDHTPVQLRSVARAVAAMDFRAIPDIVRDARMDLRRKRVERALAMDVKGGGSSSSRRSDVADRRSARMLCLSSWCALSEGRGVAVLVGFTAAFVLAYKVLEYTAGADDDDDDHGRSRRILLTCGVLVVAFRLLWWPVYWYVWGRRVNRRRQATMELYDGLNGEAAAGCELTARDRWSYDDDDDVDVDVADAEERERQSLGLEICAETGQAGVVV